MDHDDTLAVDPNLQKPALIKKGRRGRPVGDREAKRKELLQAGIKVLAEHGYAGASLRKVAQEAGYTTGAITYYFEDKDAMVQAIIEFMFDEFDAILSQADGPSTIRQRYRQWVELCSDSAIWLASFQLLSRARYEPRFAAIYQQRYQAYRDKLAEIIRAEQASGTTRRDVPAEMLADHLGSIGDGWMLMLPIEQERFAPDRVETLIDSIALLFAPPNT